MREIRGYDRFLASIEHLTTKINAHLPKNRKSLKQLLIEEEPYVETIEGSKHFFKRRELEKASETIPEKFHEAMLLPILIIRRFERGKGIFTVSGSDVEKQIIKEILGLHEAAYHRDEVTIYRVQIQELIAMLGSSLIVIGFDSSHVKYQDYDY